MIRFVETCAALKLNRKPNRRAGGGAGDRSRHKVAGQPDGDCAIDTICARHLKTGTRPVCLTAAGIFVRRELAVTKLRNTQATLTISPPALVRAFFSEKLQLCGPGAYGTNTTEKTFSFAARLITVRDDELREKPFLK
ncbi:MAG: hypothetical protein MO852_16565 [Candidatus Devosia euplotis]|nr:hypothetical protein [Candidatus Devosia euplotis]